MLGLKLNHVSKRGHSCIQHITLVIIIVISIVTAITTVFTRGQFCPSGIVIACVCGSVCPCVCVCVYVCENQILPHFELVRTITHQAFKLESPNLDRKCILALLKSLLILDLIGFDLHFNFQSWNLFFSTKCICALFVLHLVRLVVCKY